MKNIVLVIMIMMFCSGCKNSRGYQEMDIIRSFGFKSDNWYSESISVLVDEFIVMNKEKCANEIIQRVVTNDFKEIDFSFEENGYPNELAVEVYTSEEAFIKGIKVFMFEYVTEFNSNEINIQNNIKDNPDDFKIVYKEF